MLPCPRARKCGRRCGIGAEQRKRSGRRAFAGHGPGFAAGAGGRRERLHLWSSNARVASSGVAVVNTALYLALIDRCHGKPVVPLGNRDTTRRLFRHNSRPTAVAGTVGGRRHLVLMNIELVTRCHLDRRELPERTLRYRSRRGCRDWNGRAGDGNESLSIRQQIELIPKHCPRPLARTHRSVQRDEQRRMCRRLRRQMRDPSARASSVFQRDVLDMARQLRHRRTGAAHRPDRQANKMRPQQAEVIGTRPSGVRASLLRYVRIRVY